jgi:hypothetical protein
MATAKLLGRSTAATGAAEEITVGSGLSLSAGTLSASGGGVTTIGFGTTGLTPSGASSGVVTVAGTLAVANGGTGVTAASTGTGGVVLSAGPTFTGVPAAPTAANATNTTQLATTAFAYAAASKATAGYAKFPNGVIIQWGLYTPGGANTSTAVTFPVAFPTLCAMAMGQPAIARTDQFGTTTGSKTVNGCVFTCNTGGLLSNYVAAGY